MKSTWIVKSAKLVGIIVVMLLAIGLFVMLLWNALIPTLFNGPALSFWQAVGLLVLAHILLRSWGPWRYGNGWRRERWRRRFEEKLAAMTPVEREKFREEWRRCCGKHTNEPADSKTPQPNS
jgi:membrane protein implicated in regulation of membrane protease activity